MKQIKSFEQLTAHLKSAGRVPTVVVVCPDDDHTAYAVKRAVNERMAKFVLVGNSTLVSERFKEYIGSGCITLVDVADKDEAAREAVRIVHSGGADILMKGIINTDNLLHAILDKENGLLPVGKVLTHIAAMQIPSYHKLLFFSDAAVIPRPTLEQRIAMIRYSISVCRSFGVERPKIALIHCTEKVNPKFPHSLDYVEIVRRCKEGEFGDVIIDGPLDVRTSCEMESGNIKGISSPLNGDSDVLIFPNIESGNAFYKSVSLFAHADMAGLLQGPICPVVVTSRSDSSITKYYSLLMACLTYNSR